MKHVLLGLAACSLSVMASAQFTCGTDKMRAERIAADPTYLEREAALEAEIQELIRNSSTVERGRDVLVTIPIVFHILHLGGSENITNEQILNQVDLLNEDFRALNADADDVHPAFLDLVGDAEIQFVLPTLDPQGNCTNGIDRVKTPETLRGDDRSKMNPWPREKYLNVWVAESMRDGVAGYAYYPSAFEGPVQRLADGIIILNDYIGQIGTSNFNRSTALTHEIGHYLNLAHVWGNNNGVEPGAEQAPPGHMVPDCGDDGVDDTPFTRGWNICSNPTDPVFGWGTDCNAFDLDTFMYSFDGVTTSSGTTDPTPLENPTDEFNGEPRVRALVLPFSATGLSGSSRTAGKFAFAGWDQVSVDGELEYAFLPGSINTSKYYSFTIDPNVTDQLFIDSIGFKISRNLSGFRTFAVRSSVNGFSSNLPIRTGGNASLSVQAGNVGFITSDIELNDVTVYVDPPASANGYFYAENPITFRLYAWNAEDANGVARVCANGSPIDLFDRLGGAPQAGGTWSGPSATDGTFDPATMVAGTYIYTLDNGGSCPVYTASVNVTLIDPPAVPTISGNNSLCSGTTVTLTSSSNTNNRWSTGQTTPSIVVNAANTVTVTVTQNGCSSTSDPFVVDAVAAANAGSNDNLSVCSTSTPVDLFTSLGGNPATDGTWSGPSTVVDGLYDPTTMEPGEYVYTVVGNAPCPNVTSTVTVTEIATASAGTNATLSICNNAAAADLFDRLGGAPQSGGVWTGPSTTTGAYDPTSMDPGVYTYTVDLGGDCASASATITVTETNAPAVPTITGNSVFCAGGSVQLVSSSNSGNLWTPGGATTPGLNATVAGTYTVRVTSGNGCSNTSAPFVLSQQNRVNAGGDAELVACAASSDVELFPSLIGAPDAGGTWSGPSAVVDGLYQPSSMEPGIYTYVVSGTAPCPNDTSVVKVTESASFDVPVGVFAVDDVSVFGSTNLVENVENYMEYSYCSKMFSKDQTERMRFALNSATGERSSLWTEDNLRATGVADGFQATCPPQADFYARTALLPPALQTQEIPFTPTVCVGEQVQFVDNSSGSFPTTWAWTFEGGTPATSDQRNPVVTYDSPGFKNVTLTVSNANGSTTKVDGYSILIGGTPNDFTGTYNEGFQAPGMSGWVGVNYANNISLWNRTSTTGFNSNSCLMLNSGERNFLDLIDPDNGADYDDVYSPTFDLSGMDQADFFFRYAYSTQAGVIDDVTERLQVSISTDCGETWALLPGGQIEGAELINNGNNPQVPPPAWSEQALTISASRRVENVRFRFRFISSEFSNNLYIDDINISGVVGIEDLNADNFMNLFPNPTNDRFTLGVHGMDQYETAVTITDIRGAVVWTNILRPTNQSMEFSAAELGLASGLYMIAASNEAGSHTQKLMVGK